MKASIRGLGFTMVWVTLWQASGALGNENPDSSVVKKPIVLELNDTYQYNKRVMEVGLEAAIEGHHAATTSRLAPSVARVAKVGGKILAEMAIVDAPIAGWFAANAALDVKQTQLDLKLAGQAVDESIDRLDRLFGLYPIESLNGKAFDPKAFITNLRLKRNHLTGGAAPEWAPLMEAARSLVPWLHNKTADGAEANALALMGFAAEIREVIKTIAPATLAALREHYQNDERATELVLNGLTCQIQLVCIGNGGATSEQTVAVPLSFSPKAGVPVKESKWAAARGVLDQQLCLKASGTGTPNQVAQALWLPANIEPKSADAANARINEACSGIPGGLSKVEVKGAYFQPSAISLLPPTDPAAQLTWRMQVKQLSDRVDSMRPSGSIYASNANIKATGQVAPLLGYQPPNGHDAKISAK